MLAFWASSKGKCLIHCLLHWTNGIQVIVCPSEMNKFSACRWLVS